MELKTLPSQVEVTYPPFNIEAAIALRGTTRVLIGGYDNSGKSTLACSLYELFQDRSINTSLYELDRWSDTHDIILGKKPPEARSKRGDDVTVEEYALFAQNFLNDPATIVLGEIEGRYQNPHPRCLKDGADFGILITRDPIPKDKITLWPQTTSGWEDLFTEINVPIGLRVHSVQNGEIVPAGLLSVRGLNRESIPHHPDINKLAGSIVELAIINQNGGKNGSAH